MTTETAQKNTPKSPQNVPAESGTTKIICNRGGAYELTDSELKAFVTISLEEAIDLLTMGQLGQENEPANPRIGLHAVALSRVQEALEAFKAIAK